MKNLAGKFCVMAGVSCLMWIGNATTIFAAEQNPGGPEERLERIERRLNELAERQEQMRRQFGGLPERQERMLRRSGGPQERREEITRRFIGPQEPAGPIPPAGAENVRLPVPPQVSPPPLAERAFRRVGDMLGLVILVWIVCNVLLAIWIFADIRKRGEGAGIFVALALVAGLPAAIIYSLVRIGDRVSPPGK